MKLLIFGANWHNRGDEAANRAMVDELLLKYPYAEIKIVFNQEHVRFPYNNIPVYTGFIRPSKRRDPYNFIMYELGIKSNWNCILNIGAEGKKIKNFIALAKWCDYAVYAPGGPSFGDIYKQWNLVEQMHILHKYGKPYFFYAPSMGPFTLNVERIRSALNNADFICLREAQSAKFLKDINVTKEPLVTLDSAFQHSFDLSENQKKLDHNTELKKFINDGKVIGITITDLRWHDLKRNIERENRIRCSFEKLIAYLTENGYKVLFVPQLFGDGNDKDYMSTFAKNSDCFVMSDKEDCYFQQFIISKLYAVVGMRYHSNIFSAKVGTPFVSVAYEQKMSGFMEKAGYSQYCLGINDLNPESLLEKFNLLENNYEDYKYDLNNKKDSFIAESSKTTQKLCERLNYYGLR